MTNEQGKPTPFTSYFRRASGPESEWVVWNGVEDPLVVKDILAEIEAGRRGTALLDNSGLQKLKIDGPDVGKFLDYLCIRPLSNLKPGRVAYVVLTNEEGKIRDDGTSFKLYDGSYLLATGTNLLEWAGQYKDQFDVSIEEVSEDWCMLALYGPKCYSLLKATGIAGLEDLKAFQFKQITINGHTCNISRTGFSGGLGYEVWAPSNSGSAICEHLLNSPLGTNATFVGLSSLDVLRIEAGYIVPGVDFLLPGVNEDALPDDFRSPYDMGLDWMIKLDRENFIGKAVLVKESREGSKYEFYATILEESSDLGIASLYGKTIHNSEDALIGSVVAGGYSPSMQKNIGLCNVLRNKASTGDRIFIGDEKYPAELLNSPLYKSDSRTQVPPPEE